MSFRPFVYGLYDPVDPGHIRYVGMTSTHASRPRVHAKLARNFSTRPSHVTNWARKLHVEERNYEVMILEKLTEGSTNKKLLGFLEDCYINSLRRIGHKLTNQTPGGAGGNLGPEVNARRARSMLGNKNGVGHTFSEESRKRAIATRRLHYEQHPEKVVPRRLVLCPCGKTRMTKISNTIAKYCSQECYRAFKVAQNRPQNIAESSSMGLSTD